MCTSLITSIFDLIVVVQSKSFKSNSRYLLPKLPQLLGKEEQINKLGLSLDQAVDYIHQD